LPDKRVVQGDLLRSLRHAIDRLPPNYREVVILRVILALPTPTVAKWINLSEGVTLVLLWRALELVQRELQGSYAQ
jgi:DNA-directed RNA polymerase specialized sigma24 family protein